MKNIKYLLKLVSMSEISMKIVEHAYETCMSIGEYVWNIDEKWWICMTCVCKLMNLYATLITIDENVWNVHE